MKLKISHPVYFSVLYIACLIFLYILSDKYRSYGIGGEFLWGVILPLIPVFLCLWIGFISFEKKNLNRSWYFLFGVIVIALGIFLSIQLMPKLVRNYKEYALQEKTTFLFIGDEPLLSKNGNPIGIRVKYSFIFPKTYEYRISPKIESWLIYDGWTSGASYDLQINNLLNTKINPPPQTTPAYKYISSTTPWNKQETYQNGVQYTFVSDFIPYLTYTSKTNICYTPPYGNFKNSEKGDLVYELIVYGLHGPYSPPIKLKNIYKVKELYENIKKEYNPCLPKDKNGDF